MSRAFQLALGALATAAVFAPLTQARAADCEGLVGQNVGGGTVVSAERMSAGQKFVLPGPLAAYQDRLPGASAPFCRVRARVAPVPDSEVDVEVWLPEPWNGKFVGTGGGGFSGGLLSAPLTLNPLVGRGYAAAATDAGHPVSRDVAWALGQPAKVADWGHRGNHVTARFAKALIASYYAKPPLRSYFHGCSNGGRDALMEASRYPDDYDGIVAGAPAADWTGMTASFIANWQAIFQTPGAANLPSKIRAVSAAIRTKCDALDGVKDGVLENPHACRFDPVELQCKAGDHSTCLTAPEVAALRRIYAGSRLKTGQRVFAGFPVGDEDIAENASGWLARGEDGTGAFGQEFFRWMVYQDPAWKLESFQLDRDYPLAVTRVGAVVDSHHPDLGGFIARGGKLVLYHGWSDARIQADATVNYYKAAQRKIGARAVDGHVRLFMVPGMAHCTGGPGPSDVDWLAALDGWFESGHAPQQVIASKLDNPRAKMMGQPVKVVRTRPICAWPKQARWSGAGSSDQAANFTCAAPSASPARNSK